MMESNKSQKFTFLWPVARTAPNCCLLSEEILECFTTVGPQFGITSHFLASCSFHRVACCSLYWGKHILNISHTLSFKDQPDFHLAGQRLLPVYFLAYLHWKSKVITSPVQPSSLAFSPPPKHTTYYAPGQSPACLSLPHYNWAGPLNNLVSKRSHFCTISCKRESYHSWSLANNI